MVTVADRRTLNRAAVLTRTARRVVLANDSGLRQTVDGRRALRTARRATPRMTPPGAAARLAGADLRETGIVRHDVVDPALLAQLGRTADSFDRLVADDARCDDRGPREDPALHRYVVDVHQHLPELAQLITPQLGAVIEQYYGSHFRVRSVRAYRNSGPASPLDTELYADRWHLDPELTCDLRYFVYLRPTTRRNGALETVDRRTSRRVLRTGFIDRNHVFGPARRTLSGRSTVHEGPAGTGVVIDAQRVLHRAGTCAPGEWRDVVQFWLAPASTPMPPDWVHRLGPDLSFHGGRPGEG